MPPNGCEATTNHQETLMFKKSILTFASMILAVGVWAAPASAYHWNAMGANATQIAAAPGQAAPDQASPGGFHFNPTTPDGWSVS